MTDGPTRVVKVSSKFRVSLLNTVQCVLTHHTHTRVLGHTCVHRLVFTWRKSGPICHTLRAVILRTGSFPSSGRRTSETCSRPA